MRGAMIEFKDCFIDMIEGVYPEIRIKDGDVDNIAYAIIDELNKQGFSEEDFYAYYINGKYTPRETFRVAFEIKVFRND